MVSNDSGLCIFALELWFLVLVRRERRSLVLERRERRSLVHAVLERYRNDLVLELHGGNDDP